MGGERERGELKNSLASGPNNRGSTSWGGEWGGETEECQKSFEFKAKSAVCLFNLYNAYVLGQKYNIHKPA